MEELNEQGQYDQDRVTEYARVEGFGDALRETLNNDDTASAILTIYEDSTVTTF